MSSPFLPSSFMYGDSPQGSSICPLTVAKRDPSDTIDKSYVSGTLWLSDLSQGGTGAVSFTAHSVLLGEGASAVSAATTGTAGLGSG